jgi:CTP synthase
MEFRERLEKKGFVISGTSPDGMLVELIEFKPNPFLVACQFHPEFQSKPNQPHPLFREFIAAAAAESEKKGD